MIFPHTHLYAKAQHLAVHGQPASPAMHPPSARGGHGAYLFLAGAVVGTQGGGSEVQIQFPHIHESELRNSLKEVLASDLILQEAIEQLACQPGQPVKNWAERFPPAVGKDTLSHDVQPADDGTHLLDVGKSTCRGLGGYRTTTDHHDITSA